jgi:hypothetical protein
LTTAPSQTEVPTHPDDGPQRPAPLNLPGSQFSPATRRAAPTPSRPPRLRYKWHRQTPISDSVGFATETRGNCILDVLAGSIEHSAMTHRLLDPRGRPSQSSASAFSYLQGRAAAVFNNVIGRAECVATAENPGLCEKPTISSQSVTWIIVGVIMYVCAPCDKLPSAPLISTIAALWLW